MSPSGDMFSLHSTMLVACTACLAQPCTNLAPSVHKPCSILVTVACLHGSACVAQARQVLQPRNGRMLARQTPAVSGKPLGPNCGTTALSELATSQESAPSL